MKESRFCFFLLSVKHININQKHVDIYKDYDHCMHLNQKKIIPEETAFAIAAQFHKDKNNFKYNIHSK